MNQLTISELIEKLERCSTDYNEEEKQVYFDFCNFFPKDMYSYRGYYDHLAIGYKDHDSPNGAPTRKGLVQELKMMLGSHITGYKGGEFLVTKDTPVWVAKYNESTGTAVTGVIDSHIIIIQTSYYDI